VVRAIGELVDAVATGPAASAPEQPTPPPTFAQAWATVPAGPQSSLGLPVGAAVAFSDADNAWTVAVVGVQRFRRECAGALAGPPVLVVDVRVESMHGAVAVNPMLQFRYAGADGTTPLLPDRFTGCASPDLGDANLVAGGELVGRIAFVVPAGVGGSLTYGTLPEPGASWVIPEP
jgi:hypothetical protein